MKTESRRTIGAVVAAHIIIVVVVCIMNTGARPRTSDLETVAQVAFVSLPLLEAAPAAIVSPPTVVPSVDSASHVPGMRTPQAPRQPIVPSTNQVVHVSPPRSRQYPKAGEIRDQLRAGITETPIPMAVASRDRDILHDAFYGAWTPPPKAEVVNSTVTTRIVFDPNGVVQQAEIVVSSGKPDLDASVRWALRQVHRVDGLSKGILGNKEGVTVSFSVTE